MADEAEKELDENLRERARLTHLRRLLQPISSVYLRYAEGCNGRCETPRMVMELFSVAFYCCHLHFLHEHFESAQSLERQVRLKIEQGRGVLARGAWVRRMMPLTIAQVYPRGTLKRRRR